MPLAIAIEFLMLEIFPGPWFTNISLILSKFKLCKSLYLLISNGIFFLKTPIVLECPREERDYYYKWLKNKSKYF